MSFNQFKKYTLALAIASAALSAGAAHATVYSNAAAGDIHNFGYPDTSNYGQTFVLGSAATVQDWTFYATSGTSGNLDLVIAAWNGSRAVGPALYTGALAYAGGVQSLVFSGIDAALDAGSYIAYLTVAGVAGPAQGVHIEGSNTDGGLGGGFRYLNAGGIDPLTLNNTWSTFFIPNMHFTANIADASAVPVPATLSLIGLGVLGLAGVRRKQAAAKAA